MFVLFRFHIKEWMSLKNFDGIFINLDRELDTPMLESFLTFLATLVSVRTNLGKRSINYDNEGLQNGFLVHCI